MAQCDFLRTTLVSLKDLVLSHEMLHKPLADGCGHLEKIFASRELVVGARQEIEPLRTSQRFVQSLALMEGDTFIMVALHNQRRCRDSFSRPVSNLSEAVFVKAIPQTDPVRPSHDVRNRVRGLPASQFFRSEC